LDDLLNQQKKGKIRFLQKKGLKIQVKQNPPNLVRT